MDQLVMLSTRLPPSITRTLYMDQLVMLGVARLSCRGRRASARRTPLAAEGTEEEALARVEAVLRRRRRARPELEEWPVIAGELQIRGDRFQAFVAGEDLGLTRREFELLDVLARAQGRTLERGEIYRRVWGYEMAHGDRSVDVFVRKLRRKLARRSPAWRYIHTHFGVGYRFDPEPPAGRGLSPAAAPAAERAAHPAS